MTPSKVYFPNLNGLRFIAALLVIVHHIEQGKSIYGLPSFWGGGAYITLCFGNWAPGCGAFFRAEWFFDYLPAVG